MSSKPKTLFACLTLIATSGCVTASTAPVVVSDYCRVASPISYDSAKDTPETVAQIEAHNSAWVSLCGGDKPSSK